MSDGYASARVSDERVLGSVDVSMCSHFRELMMRISVVLEQESTISDARADFEVHL